MTRSPWPKIAGASAPRSTCRRSRPGSPRCMAAAWCALAARSRPAPRPMGSSRPRPGACAPSRSPIVCRCCSRPATGRSSARPTPGGAGLAAGILENTVAALGVPAAQLLAWIGPGISQAHFEVGPEVRDAFGARGRRGERGGSLHRQCPRALAVRPGRAGTAAVGGPGADGHPWREVVYVCRCRELLFAPPRWAFGTHGGLDLAHLDPTEVAR